MNIHKTGSKSNIKAFFSPRMICMLLLLLGAAARFSMLMQFLTIIRTTISVICLTGSPLPMDILATSSIYTNITICRIFTGIYGTILPSTAILHSWCHYFAAFYHGTDNLNLINAFEMLQYVNMVFSVLISVFLYRILKQLKISEKLLCCLTALVSFFRPYFFWVRS